MTAWPWQRTGVCSAGPHTAQRAVGRWSNVSCEGCWICPRKRQPATAASKSTWWLLRTICSSLPVLVHSGGVNMPVGGRRDCQYGTRAALGSPAWRAAALLPRHSAQVRGERDMTVPGTGGGRCCCNTPIPQNWPRARIWLSALMPWLPRSPTARPDLNTNVATAVRARLQTPGEAVCSARLRPLGCRSPRFSYEPAKRTSVAQVSSRADRRTLRGRQ